MRRGDGYSIEEDRPEPPQSAEELLSRYAAGERMFQHAMLSGAKLDGQDLTRANLFDADLSAADLSGTTLRAANLSTTNLQGANLREADLFDANLFQAQLGDSDLRGANLTGADLTQARLTGALLGGAKLNSTNLLDLDLSPLCEASPPIVHRGLSRVDHKAILMSLRAPHLKEFLQRTGVPEIFIEYMVDCARSISTDVFRMLRSTFICYGHPDEAFARRLYEALHRNGVAVFFFPEHAVPGEKIHRVMRRGVNENDRVILVCSRHALDRNGVLFELEETLGREARLGGAPLLIPIRLDDYVLNGWSPQNPDLALTVRDRVVADFEGADHDDTKFQAGVLRLIAALRK